MIRSMCSHKKRQCLGVVDFQLSFGGARFVGFIKLQRSKYIGVDCLKAKERYKSIQEPPFYKEIKKRRDTCVLRHLKCRLRDDV